MGRCAFPIRKSIYITSSWQLYTYKKLLIFKASRQVLLCICCNKYQQFFPVYGVIILKLWVQNICPYPFYDFKFAEARGGHRNWSDLYTRYCTTARPSLQVASSAHWAYSNCFVFPIIYKSPLNYKGVAPIQWYVYVWNKVLRVKVQLRPDHKKWG